MPDNRGPNPVLIHKYPNRRFYDTVSSRHVTLQEIHDLIVSGRDVCVTDTATGEDLTNGILMQILLEHDHVKLDLFPSSIMHMIIRSNRKALRATIERFFGPFLGIMAAGQKQFDSYVRELKGHMPSPMDWTQGMLRAFGTDAAAVGRGSDRAGKSPFSPSETTGTESRELDELRSQLELLRRRISDFDAQKPRKPAKKRAARKVKARR